jgi:hypothetical protein
MVLRFAFNARKVHVLLLRLALALIVYTSFTEMEFDPTTYALKEPFNARSMIRARPLLLFERNQHVKAAVLPDEVLGNTTYDAPTALRAPPTNVKLPPPPTGLAVENVAVPPMLPPATPIVASATPSPPPA